MILRQRLHVSDNIITFLSYHSATKYVKDLTEDVAIAISFFHFAQFNGRNLKRRNNGCTVQKSRQTKIIYQSLENLKAYKRY